jgi:hypothetical protein
MFTTNAFDSTLRGLVAELVDSPEAPYAEHIKLFAGGQELVAKSELRSIASLAGTVLRLSTCYFFLLLNFVLNKPDVGKDNPHLYFGLSLL